MSEILVSRRYARALMQAAVEEDVLESVQKDVQYLADLVRTSEDFMSFLTEPMIRPRFKQETFQAIFEERLEPITLSFLNLLAAKQRESLLEVCLADFQRAIDEAAGITTAIVRTVVPLTRSQKRTLREKLELFSGKHIRFEEELCPDVMGGVIVRIEDTVLDGSVATQLRQLEEYLAKG